MALTDDLFHLATPEALVLDGANGVSGQPRRDFPDAAPATALALTVAVLAAVVLRSRWGRSLLPGALLLTALPGAWCVLVTRADAPPARGALAATVSSSLAEVQASAPWPHGAVRVAHEDDDVLFPLGRYALPSRPEVAAPAVTLELRGASLGVRCAPAPRPGHVVCGAAP